MADAKTKVEPTELKFFYTNWRGETAERTVMPQSIYFGSTRWHPEPQWLLRALDMNRLEDRDFALAGISAAPQPAASDVPHDVVRALIFRLECLDEETQEEEAQECAREAIKVLRALATPAPATSTEEALRAENAATASAIGSVRFMDPPDGGDVSIAEQVTRMRQALESAEAENARLTEALEAAEAALADIGDATREPGDDLAWCEKRAAQALPQVRTALSALSR